jgi:hypothetical protein
MSRLIAMVAALLISALAVTTACTAARGDPSQPIRFTLERGHSDGNRLHAEFRKDRGDSHNQWSSDFPISELAGLDVAQLRSGGPVRFALVREAGRLDCAGNGGSGEATGSCRFTPNAAFTEDLVRRGMKRPSDEQALTLMAVNVRRDVIDALTAARYPVPSVDNLVSLTAVGVTGPYISNLARAGYRPKDLDTLLQFKALNITPEWIEGFVHLGYANMPADQLVQLKALDIDAAFVAGFERMGYGRLPADELVQFKALGIDGPFVAGFDRIGYGRLPADELVQFKALGITPEFVAGFRRIGYDHLSADKLVQLKALGITPDFAARMRTAEGLPSADRLVELRTGADILERN